MRTRMLCMWFPLLVQGLPPATPLGRPDAVSVEGFSTVNGLAEFRDGKVIVVDGRDRAIRIIDFAGGTVRQVGRNGDGPGEYQGPGGAVTALGDTVWTTSVGNRRVLGITPDGQIASSVEVPLSQMFRGRATYGFSAFLGRGPAGEFYWESFRFDPARRMGEATLPADIFRWRVGGDSAELVRTIVFRHKDYPVAFNRRDGWGVAADGSVAVAIGEDYHIEWIRPDGAVIKGPPTPYAHVPVNQVEREEWTRVRAGTPAGRAVAVLPGGSAGGPAPAPRPPAEVRFPEEKPPFPERNSVWVSREGEVWVVTSRPLGAPTGLVDVFDRSGRRVRQVELPAKSQIAGFGTRTVYLAREDEDGLLWIERYRLR